MGATAGAATAAAASAVQPLSASDLVNIPAGSPAQEIWPGAVDPSQYLDPGTPVQAAEGPPYGSWTARPFTEVLAEVAPEGGIQDTAWMTGTDGPQAPWDSSAGQPFAPSGALPPELHAEDTGAVFQAEYVVPALVTGLTRRTRAGETYNEVAPTQTTIGQTAPAGRANYDQYQDWNPDGHDPWDIPYAERGLYSNLAYQDIATTAYGQGPDGALPDMAPYSYAAQAYEAPPDPSVSPPPMAAAAGSYNGGGWLLG